MKYVNLVIENSSNQTDRLFTYGTNIENIQVGDKVWVPFARGNKIRAAYVFQVMDQLEEEISGLKLVESRDSEVSLPAEAVETCIWMKRRYFCRYIDAVNCFTPAGSSSKRGKKRNPYKDALGDQKQIPHLTQEQEQALDRIRPRLEKREHCVFLIHGVTASGKTEVYLQTIDICLKQGRTAILLVPEISLTAQTIHRVIGRFGAEQVAVLHSRLSLGERFDEWIRVRTGQVKIVIGARSAVFAPLSHIGVVIMDEEHETTYKSDMSPKYDTLEVAVKRARAHGAVALLGSATPSLTSAWRAEQGLFEKISLRQRYNKAPLPQVSIVDMREELKNGNRSIFSIPLYQAVTDNLTQGRQVILFLNRRGYSTFISCRECGYVMKCPDCGISLTYHKEQNAAVCHFCGYRAPIPGICPDCGSQYIRHFGTGTEKVEEAAKEMFPQASVERLDFDTSKKKGSGDQILHRFGKGKTDILIGTQLVAKGLDFANVGLVGVISADVSLNIPDFRSPERTFQLITQAAGRAGRGDLPGKVIIQSYTPDHYAITAASNQDYEAFYQQELSFRRQTGYPPFSELIQIVISSKLEEEAQREANQAADYLRRELSKNKAGTVLGPHPAPIHKVSGQFRFQLLVKCPPGSRKTYTAVIGQLRHRVGVQKRQKGREVQFSADVNPYSFL